MNAKQRRKQRRLPKKVEFKRKLRELREGKPQEQTKETE